jgi:hypothetical protein
MLRDQVRKGPFQDAGDSLFEIVGAGFGRRGRAGVVILFGGLRPVLRCLEPRLLRRALLGRRPFGTASAGHKIEIENESQQHERGPVQVVPARCPLRSCVWSSEATKDCSAPGRSTGYGSEMSGRHRRYKGNG